MQTTGLFWANPRHGTEAAELYNIEDPGPNDVLFGRGTGSNMHSGNVRFRALIQQYKAAYRDTPKKMKPSVSTKVVAIWRSQNPPGRFLFRSDRFHGCKRTFYDVGDAMARRKAAQCLREKSSKERICCQLKEDDRSEKELQEDIEDLLTESVDGSWSSWSSSSIEKKRVSKPNNSQEQVECTNSRNEGINIFIENILSNNSVTMQKLSANNIIKPSEVMKEVNASKSAAPATMKSMEFADREKERGLWSSSKKVTFSLVDTYASKLEGTSGTSDSLFHAASFGFENNHGDNDGGEGLCFPSLFGGGSSKTTSNLFDDEGNSSAGLLGRASSSLFQEEPEEALSFPSGLSLSVPITQKKDVLVQNIGESVPTAASLTNSFFDW